MGASARALRWTIAALAAAQLVVGWGFYSRADWALPLWPWVDSPLNYRFVGAMLLSQGTTMAWTAWRMELRAALGGLVGFALTTLGIAAYTGWLATKTPTPVVLGWAAVNTLLFAGTVGLAIVARASQRHGVQPVPAIVRGSFLVFAIALAIATVALVAQAPVVFPWPLRPEGSVIYGLLFLASAVYFFDGWLRPGSDNALGQLLGFLVYDLALFPPWLAHWPKAVGGYRISLVIYLVVLTWSALLAIAYLAVRLRPARLSPPPPMPAPPS